MSKFYFSKPTQLAFWDIENEMEHIGIGYRDEIITIESGSIFEADDLGVTYTDIWIFDEGWLSFDEWHEGLLVPSKKRRLTFAGHCDIEKEVKNYE